MEIYQTENLSFRYPTAENNALSGISLAISEGELVTVCGKSGCGKSTLLRLLKPPSAPHGTVGGKILFMGKDISELDFKAQSECIGFVAQNPDNQIVTDKVWHELAFGLENLGIPNRKIRARVAEMASYFGIGAWFHKKTSELSGGQKQLLNLAAVMVMQPSVLILDEPTSHLDPIAAQEFLNTVAKINRELGTTVIIAEHRLEDALPLSSRVIVMDGGRIIADCKPHEAGIILKERNHDMLAAMPTATRVFSAVSAGGRCPVSVCEGRAFLEGFAAEHSVSLREYSARRSHASDCGAAAVELKDVWFGYEKDAPSVIKGLSVKIRRGELFAVVGGNGTGKTTALSLMCGILKPQRGKILFGGKPISRCGSSVAMLPQNPQALFARKTVRLELTEMQKNEELTETAKTELEEVTRLCKLETLLDRHPYDLSGGEQQRAALAKLLLLKPQVILMDEPTKGMDAHFRKSFAAILDSLTESGVTVVMVSHDIEFCAEYADRTALLFDGSFVAEDAPRQLFSGNSFYTTAACRMSQNVLCGAVLAEDIILSCGGSLGKSGGGNTNGQPCSARKADSDDTYIKPQSADTEPQETECISEKYTEIRKDLTEKSPKGSAGRKIMAAVTAFVVIPLTILIGKYFFSDRKYYFISLLIILEIFIPFCASYEKRMPQAREAVILSVLCAIAVAGRAAFFMLPQFKPSLAVIIIAGACFGGEQGFLVGAVCAFVSNFYFGQGPWTPWQMLASGLAGYAAGVLAEAGVLRKTRIALCIYGALAATVIHGGILNPATVLMSQDKPTVRMFAAAYAMGVPYDLILAAATVFFLWIAAEPMLEKLERIKIKYGLNG